MEVNEDMLRKFVKQCFIAQSINFPDVAYNMKLSWRKDIKPFLQEPWFREEMEEMLERIKFNLVDSSYQAATKGAPPGKMPPPVAHIKEIMKLIDSGMLLGGARSEGSDNEPALSEEEERRHRHRLGLTDETKI